MMRRQLLLPLLLSSSCRVALGEAQGDVNALQRCSSIRIRFCRRAGDARALAAKAAVARSPAEGRQMTSPPGHRAGDQGPPDFFFSPATILLQKHRCILTYCSTAVQRV